MMDKFKNWKEVTKGLYRYIISSNCCYEIHILHWDFETDILTEDTATDSREEALAVLREFYPDLEEDGEVQMLWFVHDRRD